MVEVADVNAAVERKDYAALAKYFEELRTPPPTEPQFANAQTEGHTDVPIQPFNGAKHLVMKALQEKFGAKGTPVSDIFKTLGQPNAMLPVYQPNKLNPEPGTPGHFHQYMMPGPVIPPPPAQAQGGAGGQQEPHGEVSIGLPAAQPPTAVAPPFDLMYYWRGRHDYMWFRIDPTTEKVIASDWYHAYE